MRSDLVLSIFPGIGLLDYALNEAGFTTVRGPDPLWGGDIRTFDPPPGAFDGLCGGDPCQSFSALSNLVRAKGLEPKFGDLSGEFSRCVSAARPIWFLRENVPQAPDIAPEGYDVRSFRLDNAHMDSGDGWGNEQMRTRKFWFGVREDHGPCPELRKYMDFALFELPDVHHAVGYKADMGPGMRDALRRRQQAVAGDAPSVPVAIGGSGKRKVTAVGGHDGTVDAINGYRKARDAGGDYSPPRRTLEEMCRLQGLPEDFMEHQPWLMGAKRKMVGNGVPITLGRQLAGAILAWREET